MVLDVWDPLLNSTITWRITMNTQTILSATTCAQLTNIMAQLEELQALVISQYEGIAMQEQEQISKLENHEDIVDTTDYARSVCEEIKREFKHIHTNPELADQDYLEHLSDALLLAIDECKQFNVPAHITTYCEALHCRLISVYEGVVMSQEA